MRGHGPWRRGQRGRAARLRAELTSPPRSELRGQLGEPQARQAAASRSLAAGVRTCGPANLAAGQHRANGFLHDRRWLNLFTAIIPLAGQHRTGGDWRVLQLVARPTRREPRLAGLAGQLQCSQRPAPRANACSRDSQVSCRLAAGGVSFV
jgi:hypothetical protein